MLDICSIELGFGWTKGTFKNRVFRQPSITGESKPMFDYKKDDFVFNEQCFVGDLALRHSDIKYFSMKDNKASDIAVTDTLLQTGIGYLTRSAPCNVISTLPIKFYFNQKVELENKIFDLNNIEPYKIRCGLRNSFSVTPNIDQVKITPQGQGIAMDFLLDNDGKIAKRDFAKKRILVLDLGFYTLNILGLDKLEIMPLSTTLLLGVDTAYKLLQRYIQETVGKSPARYELDQYVIAGRYEGYDIRPLIKRAFRALAIQIQNEVEGLNMSFDVCLIGGGAAHQIFEFISFEEKYLFDQLAQVRGNEKIGIRTWK